jgi:hypothetical protein
MATSTRTNLYVPTFDCEVPRCTRDDNAFTLAVTSSWIGKGSGFRESLFFAQLRQHAEILQRRRVASHAFATGNFLE